MLKIVVQANTKKTKSYNYWADQTDMIVFSPIAPTLIKKATDSAKLATWIDTKNKDVLYIVNRLMAAFEQGKDRFDVVITVGGRDGYNKIAYQLYSEYKAREGKVMYLQVFREKGDMWGQVRYKSWDKLLGRGVETIESATASA